MLLSDTVSACTYVRRGKTNGCNVTNWLISCLVILVFAGLPISLFVPSLAAAEQRRMMVTKGDSSYENSTISEDATWKGTILIKGSVVIAPQATIRLEPGTTVRFMSLDSGRQTSRLVVMGRIQGNGTADRPIVFAPNLTNPVKGDWGGILLISSEKRNVLEHCLIEGAEVGIEARFSTISTTGVTVTRSVSGMVLHDSIATISESRFTACDTGIEMHDSEADIRSSMLSGNQRGLVVNTSSLVMSSVTVQGNQQQGLQSGKSRLKIASSSILDNQIGATITDGEGQIFMTKFSKNREVGLHLSGSHIKINRCNVFENKRDGVRLDDNRSTIWGNAIYANGGFNVVSNGRSGINLVQNWWGLTDESAIRSKLSVSSRDASSGSFFVAPWLTEKPSLP